METLMGIVLGAAAIVSLVCWILILIKIFRDSIGLGILGIICGIFAFVYGWVKVKEYDCKNIMLAWTAAAIVSIVANLLGGAVLVKSIMGVMEESENYPSIEVPAEM